MSRAMLREHAGRVPQRNSFRAQLIHLGAPTVLRTESWFIDSHKYMIFKIIIDLIVCYFEHPDASGLPDNSSGSPDGGRRDLDPMSDGHAHPALLTLLGLTPVDRQCHAFAPSSVPRSPRSNSTRGEIGLTRQLP